MIGLDLPGVGKICRDINTRQFVVGYIDADGSGCPQSVHSSSDDAKDMVDLLVWKDSRRWYVMRESYGHPTECVYDPVSDRVPA